MPSSAQPESAAHAFFKANLAFAFQFKAKAPLLSSITQRFLEMALHGIRSPCRQWLGSNLLELAGACAFVLLVLVFTFCSWEHEERKGRRVQDPVFRSLDSPLVDPTLLRDYKAKGALCLDGSPPGYHILRGKGSGSDNWLLHLEGGGWCNNAESCASRARTTLGSSVDMGPTHFTGILSPYPSQNPDFLNWNKVKVRYCDGASFTGGVEGDDQNGLKLFFRGQHIWEAIIDQLLSDGLAKAKQSASFSYRMFCWWSCYVHSL